MPFDLPTLPEWAHPLEIHRILVAWLGPEMARTTELATVVILVGALVVKFWLVPLGIKRRGR